MKSFMVTLLFIVLFVAQVFAGSGRYSKTAAFSNKINNALKLASYDENAIERVNKIKSDGHFECGFGTSSYQSNFFKEALDLLGVN